MGYEVQRWCATRIHTRSIVAYFILFINDMPLHTNGDVDMYSVDSTLSAVGKSVKELDGQ